MAWVIEPNLERDDEGGDDLSFLRSSLITNVIGIAVLLLMQYCNLQADCMHCDLCLLVAAAVPFFQSWQVIHFW